jgi:uncharacterized protein (TIGR02145 family)
VTAAKIADNAITSAKIADGTILAADLSAMGAANGQVLKYNGTIWVPANVAPVAITAQPKAFSWSRLKDTNGDPNGPATATIAALSVTATGFGTLTYQWYQKSANPNAPTTKLTGATASTYAPVVTDWGMKSYYCVVKNGNDSVVSTIADVAIGCGAKTNQGRWLRFMCHNLGADTSLDPFVYKSINDTTSRDIKGWLFQWGRAADGHQWRSSDTIKGPYSSTTSAAVPISHTMYGKFIISYSTFPFADWRTPQYDIAWRNNNTPIQPCPSGWRIPTADEWGSIYRDGSSYGTPAAATANTWTWITTSGFQLKPDGVTVTLFLPAAGCRYPNTGNIVEAEETAAYWSSTAVPSKAFGAALYQGSILVNMQVDRGLGYSLRCVSTALD